MGHISKRIIAMDKNAGFLGDLWYNIKDKSKNIKNVTKPSCKKIDNSKLFEFFKKRFLPYIKRSHIKEFFTKYKDVEMRDNKFKRLYDYIMKEYFYHHSYSNFINDMKRIFPNYDYSVLNSEIAKENFIADKVGEWILNKNVPSVVVTSFETMANDYINTSKLVEDKDRYTSYSGSKDVVFPQKVEKKIIKLLDKYVDNILLSDERYVKKFMRNHKTELQSINDRMELFKIFVSSELLDSYSTALNDDIKTICEKAKFDIPARYKIDSDTIVDLIDIWSTQKGNSREVNRFADMLQKEDGTLTLDNAMLPNTVREKIFNVFDKVVDNARNSVKAKDTKLKNKLDPQKVKTLLENATTMMKQKVKGMKNIPDNLYNKLIYYYVTSIYKPMDDDAYDQYQRQQSRNQSMQTTEMKEKKYNILEKFLKNDINNVITDFKAEFSKMGDYYKNKLMNAKDVKAALIIYLESIASNDKNIEKDYNDLVLNNTGEENTIPIEYDIAGWINDGFISNKIVNDFGNALNDFKNGNTNNTNNAKNQKSKVNIKIICYKLNQILNTYCTAEFYKNYLNVLTNFGKLNQYNKLSVADKMIFFRNDCIYSNSQILTELYDFIEKTCGTRDNTICKEAIDKLLNHYLTSSTPAPKAIEMLKSTV